MELPRLALDLDLHARDEPQARAGRPRLCPRDAGQGVVVGEGQCAEVQLQGQLDEPLGLQEPSEAVECECRSTISSPGSIAGRVSSLSFDITITHCVSSCHGPDLPRSPRGRRGVRAASRQVDNAPGADARCHFLGACPGSGTPWPPVTAFPRAAAWRPWGCSSRTRTSGGRLPGRRSARLQRAARRAGRGELGHHDAASQRAPGRPAALRRSERGRVPAGTAHGAGGGPPARNGCPHRGPGWRAVSRRCASCRARESSPR